MRILMTADTVGGVWTYALQLSKSLAARDVIVELATGGAPLTDRQREAARAIKKLSVHESSFRLEWMEDPWQDVRAAGEWLLDLAAKIRPDLVHLNDYSQGALAWPAPVLMVGHSCVASWHEAARGAAAGAEWDCYREHVARGLRGADLVVAPTRAMLESLKRFYGPLPNSEVIPNGRDGEMKNLEDKQPIILTAGRLWDEAKNITLLAAAAKDIEWPVYVAGEATHPDGGVAVFKNLTALGKLEPGAMKEWFGAASIYVHPARYEPFGLAPLEAALRGCALVLADIPTLREVWGEAAMFVAPDQPAELAKVINEMIENSSMLRDFGKRARHHALKYSASRMAGGYFSAYRRLSGLSEAAVNASCSVGA